MCNTREGGSLEVGSRPNRAEQKQRQNVIENPLRCLGEKSREERDTTGVIRRRRTGKVVGFYPAFRRTSSADISCVHTVERTRSIVNGRLMEWNSHLFSRVLSSYIQPPPSFPPFLQPCVRIVKLLPAHCRCFPFMAPDMVDLIRVFLFLLLFLFSRSVFFFLPSVHSSIYPLCYCS